MTVAPNAIRVMMDNWREGLSEKDAHKMLRDYADDAILVDMTPAIHKGKRAIIDIWEEGFPMLPDDVTVEYKDLEIFTSEESAVFIAQAKMNSQIDPDNMACKNWARVSVSFLTRDGRLQAVHEHVSLPVESPGV